VLLSNSVIGVVRYVAWKIVDSRHWISCSQTNQLDFLLERASEYSNFIAQDLQELQAGMAMEAAAANAKADKKKKRKGETSASSSKKLKNNKSKAALVTAQAKDTKVPVGGTPIFLQPTNLAAGCILKDYQSEGVRWMASLFENGVSGILADEVRILLEENVCRHTVISCFLFTSST
jgi:SNF2 family DNA or RNA helicase